MEFSTKSEFDKEFDNLRGKYSSLVEDLEQLKKVLRKNPRGYRPIIFRISSLGIESEVYKVKHFRCKALRKGSRSGIRIIYAYLPEIEFVEIYYKEKDNTDCNKKRILKYYK